MNNQPNRRDEDAILESIVFAFQGKLLPEIRLNRNNSAAFALLSASLLEQFSGFLFTGPDEARVQQYVEAYMPQYIKVGLYSMLRNVLYGDLYEYFVKAFPDSSAGLSPGEDWRFDPEVVHNVFMVHLEAGIISAAEEMRSNSTQRRRAIEWYRDHPVELLEGSALYTPGEQEKLIDYYVPLFKAHFLFADDSSELSLGLNFWEKGHLINVLIRKIGGYEHVRVPLFIFIGLMGLKSPVEVLGSAAGPGGKQG